MALSNKTLTYLVILAMSVSFFSTLTLLNRLKNFSVPEEITGKAQSVQGEINLTVESAISIILRNASIDFGSGFVNTSGPKATPCANFATLNITYNGGNPLYVDSSGNDCWNSFIPGQPTEPISPFLIENEGNQNVTLTVTGPTPLDFFNNEAGLTNPAYYDLSWKGVNIEANACSVPGDFTDTWTTFGGTQTICDNDRFGFISGADELAVDIQVQIPTTGLSPGTEYKNSTITFTAS